MSDLEIVPPPPSTDLPGPPKPPLCVDPTRLHSVIRLASLRLPLLSHDPTQLQDLLPESHWPGVDSEAERFLTSNDGSRSVTPPDGSGSDQARYLDRGLLIPNRESEQ